MIIGFYVCRLPYIAHWISIEMGPLHDSHGVKKMNNILFAFS